MEASEGLRRRRKNRRQRGNDEMDQMLLVRQDETSPLDAGRSIGAPSPGNLNRPRKMKDESHLVGREHLVNELLPQLIHKRDDGALLRVISVVGDEAVGKTALVRSVYNRADVKNHFDDCAWVQVRAEPTLCHLLVRLLKQLRVIAKPRDEKRLSSVLRGVLTQCCYLIVLDDLSDVHLMDKLMMVLPDSRNGSRVIVTTRNPEIPSLVPPCCSTQLKLSPLDREQSDDLLIASSWAFDVVDPPAQLLHLKDWIFSKSDGSPAKILLLGGLLSANTMGGCTELAGLLPDRPTVQDVVDLSITKLPEQLKQCALYLSMYPKESEIPTRRLFGLWSALSSPLENGVTRVDAEKCFDDLVSRNMVHVARRKWDGSARSYRLPGMMHDVFSLMAEHRRFLNDCSIHERFYDFSIHERFGDDAKFDATPIPLHRHISGGEAKATSDNSAPWGIKQLCSYVSLGTLAREMEALLKPLVPRRHSSLLRVLDLEGVYKPLLPEELGNILLNLKYLGLRWTFLELLPKSVVRLPCLETLDLRYTNITQVPAFIWEVDSLRHLYMSEVSFDKSVHPQLHSKKSLICNIQTICGLHVGVGSPMLKVLGKLTGLRKLAVTCYPSVVREASKQILNLNKLESLRLQSRDVFDQPSDLEPSDMRGLESLSKLYLIGKLPAQRLSESHVPRNLKVLTLSMSGLKEDPMAVLGKLEFLTTLRFFGYSYKGKILSVPEGTFPSLRVLKLWRLENLTEWTIQASAMRCLEDLEIKYCKKLKTIDGLQQIKNLEGITLVKVPDELKQRVREMQLHVPILAA